MCLAAPSQPPEDAPDNTMCFVPSPTAPAQDYHQVHRPSGLLPCPCCLRETLIVRSFGTTKEPRQYYVTCHSQECEGEYNGPVRFSIRDAVRDSNETLVAFAKAVVAMA